MMYLSCSFPRSPVELLIPPWMWAPLWRWVPWPPRVCSAMWRRRTFQPSKLIWTSTERWTPEVKWVCRNSWISILTFCNLVFVKSKIYLYLFSKWCWTQAHQTVLSFGGVTVLYTHSCICCVQNHSLIWSFTIYYVVKCPIWMKMTELCYTVLCVGLSDFEGEKMYLIFFWFLKT